jgi:hypothetical protein
MCLYIHMAWISVKLNPVYLTKKVINLAKPFKEETCLFYKGLSAHRAINTVHLRLYNSVS